MSAETRVPGVVEGAGDVPRWHSALVFAAGVLLMAAVYGATIVGPDAGVPGNDSFYHLKMAAMLPEVGLVHEFPWLRFVYFTKRGQAFVSHHYGFHALLAPFVRLSLWLTGDDLRGGPWAICVFFGFVLVLFDRLVREARAGTVWVWMPLLALMPYQFFTRMAFIRAIAPSLVCMLWMLILLFRGRGLWLALAIAVYIHLYMGGVLFAPLIVGAFLAASLVVEPQKRRAAFRLALWALAGWVAGVLTHPYVNGMWDFLRLQVFGSGLSPDIPVGKEWKPFSDPWWVLQMCGFVVAAWLMGVVLRLRHGRPVTTPELCLFILNVIFGVLMAKARRFIEYWPVFCLLSAIFLAAPCWTARVRDFLSRRAVSLGSVALAAGIVGLAPVWDSIRADARCGYDLPAIQGAMAFLEQDSAAGDVVFTDDWDIFPAYFYYNSHNHYIVGLDPKFTQWRQPELWERYVKISRGQIPAEVPVGAGGRVHVRLEDIRDQFGAKYVVTDRDHKALASRLAEAEEFAELVYPRGPYRTVQDSPYLVFRIKASRQERE